MRFAYIDSHGNEVPIPSVDALALRIELGAIGPDTELYDAQADHWGPARTHEIFHTLSRDLGEEGFVAPPPPVAPAHAAPPPTPPAPVTPSAAEVTEPEPEGPEEAGKEFDLGLTLADPPPAPPEDGRQKVSAEPGELSFDLAPLDSEETALGESHASEPSADKLASTESTTPAAADDAEAEEGFDFGDLGSGLELEDLPMDFSQEAEGSGVGGGMELETEMEFTGPGGADVGDEELQLEQPMSEFQPDAPPGWMEGPDTGTDDDMMDFSSVAADVAAEEKSLVPPAEAPARERRTPRDRPSPPKFKSQRSLSGPIVLAVILLAIGVGGYVGWPILRARLAASGGPARPPVVMPSIPAELMPRMRSLAEAAMAEAVEEVDRNTLAEGTPTEPDENWLAGIYLGNASQFGSVEAFWSSIEQFVQGVRSAEWQLFHDKYVERVETEGVADEEAALLIERADSGFVAAAPMRDQAYAAMERLVDVSLDLHDFLVRNEANIEYRPANASTADPVLEAVPTSPELGDQMWAMVDSITDALDALGSLDRVTRERLKGALVARLQQVGIQ